jgi:hypothetical protein
MPNGGAADPWRPSLAGRVAAGHDTADQVLLHQSIIESDATSGNLLQEPTSDLRVGSRQSNAFIDAHGLKANTIVWLEL